MSQGAIIPGQYVDVLALAGDAVDNVPGVRPRVPCLPPPASLPLTDYAPPLPTKVKRVGIKTALALVSKFGSVDSVLENAEEVPPLLPPDPKVLGG